MSHVHITSNGEMVGTLFLDRHGHVADDGSPAAQNAIDHTNHGLRREHGQAALDAIVRHFDRSTLVGAYHCDDAWCSVSRVKHREPSAGQSAATPSRRPFEV